nr:MAG TPA: hypothetical protein [Caudoviricetes sp.]
MIQFLPPFLRCYRALQPFLPFFRLFVRPPGAWFVVIPCSPCSFFFFLSCRRFRPPSGALGNAAEMFLHSINCVM